MSWKNFKTKFQKEPEELGLCVNVVDNPSIDLVVPRHPSAIRWYHDLNYAYYVIGDVSYISLYKRENCLNEGTTQIVWLLDNTLSFGKGPEAEDIFFKRFYINGVFYDKITEEAILEIQKHNEIRAYFDNDYMCFEKFLQYNFSFIETESEDEDELSSEEEEEYLTTYASYLKKSLDLEIYLHQNFPERLSKFTEEPYFYLLEYMKKNDKNFWEDSTEE